MGKRNSLFIPFLVGALVITVVFAVCCVIPIGGREARANGAGTYWKLMESNTTNKLEGVFALDSNHVWAVGEKGTIVFYNGTAWSQPIDLGIKNHLYAVVAFNENDVWVLGDKVKIHYAGSWQLMPIEECVTGASLVPKKPGGGEPSGPYQAWACTDKGNYYTYYDSDWHYEVVGHNKQYDVAANCEGTAWSVGGDAHIERWKNGWRTVHTGIGRKAIRGVSTCGNQKLEYRHHVLAVGQGHECLFSEDGLTFKKGDTGTNTETLCGVTYPDESNAWAVGNKSTIVYSDDVPNKWSTQMGGTSQQSGGGSPPDLYGASALDQYNAWAVGDKGTIYQTVPPSRIVGCNVRLSPLNRVVQGEKYNVDVTGSDTHFSSQSQAQFGDGIQVETSFIDGTHVTASITVDKDAKTGSRDVDVITGSETPVPLSDGVEVVAATPAPQLDNLDPNHATTGTPITLNGKHFGASQGLSSYVTFNGKKAHNYTSWSDDQVVVEVPSGATSGPVEVTNGAGTSNSKHFTVDEPQVPTIVGCYPNSVAQGENKLVTIRGSYTHFQKGENGEAVSNAVFDPPDGITVLGTTVESSEIATVNIVVDADAPTGTRSVNVITGSETPTPLDGHFTIISNVPNWPALDSLSTDRGSSGDQVTLSGQNFGSERGSSFVSFNGVESTDYASWSDTSITCTVPTGATTGPVTVTTPVGTSGGILFTVGSPYIKDCDPTELVQGHEIDNFHILGDFTHFEQGKSMAVLSGGGLEVGSTYVSDATHTSTTLKVAADAMPGTRDVNVITGSENPAPLKNVLTVHEAPTSPPELYSIAPGSGPVGSMVYIKGENFGAARGSSQVTFSGTPVTTYLFWCDHEVVLRVPTGATSGMVEIQTPWGNSNNLHFGVSCPTFYFAEGTARPGFDPYLCIQNPGEGEADVRVTYMKGDGTTDQQELTVPPTTRTTVNPKDILGEADNPAHDFSSIVESTNGEQIIVERPMYFNYQGAWPGGSDVMGALVPAPYFFFAEGTCRPDYTPYLTIQNPGEGEADVKITYMKGDGTTDEQNFTVPPTTRTTVNPKETLGEAEDAAYDFSCQVQSTNGQRIVVERPMYFNYKGVWPGGHDVLGAVVPAKSFYFAEGTCRSGFQPYISIENPCKSDASVVITYMRGDGTTWEQAVTVPAHSRSTVNARDSLGWGDNPSYDFSCLVECNNNLWIVAERPMYFCYQGSIPGGSDVVGAISPADSFYFSEGTCRTGFDTYICIQNPGIAHAYIKVTYMRGDGTTAEQMESVPANSRITVIPEDTLGIGDDTTHDFSTKVESTNGVGIVCERPMYFNYNGVWPGGHDVIGFAP